TDSGFVIAGGIGTACLIKINALGDTLWTRKYNGINEITDLAQTSDGGIIFLSTVSLGSGDLTLIKTDGNGNITWSKVYGNADTEYSETVRENTDNGFIISGYQTIMNGNSIQAILL